MGYNSKNRAPAAGQFSCADPVMIAVYTPAPVYSAPALETTEYGWAFGGMNMVPTPRYILTFSES